MQAQDILKKYWGYTQFRGLQQNIVQSVLKKHDVLAILPTGGGKSICFQVPALMTTGLCIVVSPLIALMKDQVYNLEKRNIKAKAIYAGLSKNEVDEILYKSSKGEYKFLYVSPERLQSKIFKLYLNDLPVSLIAIDEAHCISQWGYDFRPSYLLINILRESKPFVPVIALTASATKLVKDDIVEKLKLKNHSFFQQSFHKPNLSYSAFNVVSKINKVVEILNNVQGSSVVYCKNRRHTTYVAELLKLQNISADFYHAGLLQQERNLKQENWINNKTRVIVCTNAFGMGIDKPDVRTVIHYDIPDCLENYYQEAGRAGRDGKRAFAILLYNNDDVQNLLQSAENKFPNLSKIKEVYRALANYLQLPVGLGMGNQYDFDVVDFARNFKLDVQLAINVLKILEAEGHFVLTESVFIPSKIQVIIDKNSLENFCDLYKSIENTLKGLLRTYVGILDGEVRINEKRLAKATQQSYEKIEKDLKFLLQHNVIKYTIQKESPQLIFILNRAEVDNLHIDETRYKKRKIQYENRINALVDFVKITTLCRSKIIGNYFEDFSIEDCNVCDNCIKKKTKPLTRVEFENFKTKILSLAQNSEIKIDNIEKQFKSIKKEKFWQLIDFMKEEKLILIDSFGIVHVLKS